MSRRQTHQLAARILLNATCTLAALGSCGYALAQPLAAQPPQIGTAAPAITWASLTASQKAALAPLQSSWESLSDGHQRKWIALSQNFANMSSVDKEKLHSRMVEWAALKPKERQQARLNFAETKKTPPEQRAANWEAYQALSTEEKEALARTAAAKPAGAAIATKAPAPQKLTPVPVTRNSPDTQKEKLAAQQPVDRNTLLPLAPPPKSNATN